MDEFEVLQHDHFLYIFLEATESSKVSLVSPEERILDQEFLNRVRERPIGNSAILLGHGTNNRANRTAILCS